MNDFELQMAALRSRFAGRCADFAAQLRALGPEPLLTERANVRTIVHKIAGTSGMFGLPELGDIARTLDIWLIESPDTPALNVEQPQLDLLLKMLDSSASVSSSS